MVYSVDITEEGKKCEIIIKGETLTCVVVYAYEWINKNKEVIRKTSRIQRTCKCLNR